MHNHTIMAEISQNSSRNSKGRNRQKRKSTRIDMTAMVDVAFLLLTFFVLTATLSDQFVVELVMPVEGPTAEIAEQKLLTLVLEENDEITYYHGITEPNIQTTHYGVQGLRKVLQEHLNRYEHRCEGKQKRDCWDPIFLIKPKQKATYRNVVDVLDELAIVQAPKYAIGDFTPADSAFLVVHTSE